MKKPYIILFLTLSFVVYFGQATICMYTLHAFVSTEYVLESSAPVEDHCEDDKFLNGNNASFNLVIDEYLSGKLCSDVLQGRITFIWQPPEQSIIIYSRTDA